MVTPPVDFKRGATFSFMFSLPASADLTIYKGCRLRAQIRKARNDLPSGKIADLAVFWLDPTKSNKIVLHHSHTERWALGHAEIDVQFITPDGVIVPSKTMVFNITLIITQ